MKKTASVLLMIVLLVAEMYLLCAILPTAWQTAITQKFLHRSPNAFDHSIVTHPALGYEIDDMLKKNTTVRIAFYLLIISLLGGNTFLLVRIWIFLRRWDGFPFGPQ